MYKRLVKAYVKDELEKGKNIDKIRKKLLKSGYKEKDVNSVLRTYEFREKDLMNKGEEVAVEGTTSKIWLVVALVIIVINAAFFYYYFTNPNYVLVRETPTGLVVEDITEEELRNLEMSLNASNGVEGLTEIS